MNWCLVCNTEKSLLFYHQNIYFLLQKFVLYIFHTSIFLVYIVYIYIFLFFIYCLSIIYTSDSCCIYSVWPHVPLHGLSVIIWNWNRIIKYCIKSIQKKKKKDTDREWFAVHSRSTRIVHNYLYDELLLNSYAIVAHNRDIVP